MKKRLPLWLMDSTAVMPALIQREIILSVSKFEDFQYLRRVAKCLVNFKFDKCIFPHNTNTAYGAMCPESFKFSSTSRRG